MKAPTRFRGLAVTAGLSSVILASCLSRSPRGIPLYDTSKITPSEAAVAQIIGPIISVDDMNVDSGVSAYELLPGCHVIEIGGTVDHVDPRVGGEIGTLPRLFYPVWMMGGNIYVVEIEPEPNLRSGLITHSRVVFREKNRAGQILGELAATSDGRRIRNCREGILAP